MNFRRIASALLMVSMVAVAAMSCKKEEEEYPSLDGSLVIGGNKQIIMLGTSLYFTASGIVEPEGKTVTYTWTVSADCLEDNYSITSEKEDHGFTFVFEDGLDTYTVTCSASCSGYYSSSATASVTTIQYGLTGSLPEAYAFKLDCETVSDADGTEYKTTAKSEGQVWTNRNLQTKGEDPTGIPYRGFDVLDGIFGRYYSYEEAIAICPSGWHLPTDAEWMQAAQTQTTETLVEHAIWPGVAGSFMTDGHFNGTKMWEYWPAVKITNKLGMNVLPLGYGDKETTVCVGLYDFAVFWTADKVDDTHAYCRQFIVDQPDIHPFVADTKSFAASVRCVKD